MTKFDKFKQISYVEWPDLAEFLVSNLKPDQCLVFDDYRSTKGADYVFMRLLSDNYYNPASVHLTRIVFSDLSEFSKYEYAPLIKFLKDNFGSELRVAFDLGEWELIRHYGFSFTD